MSSVLYKWSSKLVVNICREFAAAAAIGIGVGAALAASIGQVGYLLGLLGAVGVAASSAIRVRRS